MRDPINETELISKILAGELELFRTLVEAHQDRVYRVCSHILCDPTSAEDLAQDTFVTAFRKLDRYEPAKGALSVWILTIARRLCINALKKAQPLSMAHLPETACCSRELPDHCANSADAFQALDDALAKLPDDFRRCYVFAEIEELSHEEIVRIEGIAIGTVKSRVSRAKKTLRRLLLPIYQEYKDIAP